MGDNFEVGSVEGELDERTRHEIVAAQLRGEEKASGQAPAEVIESVAQELRAIGVEPDQDQLQRRYAAIDPDLPVLGDSDTVAQGDDRTDDRTDDTTDDTGQAGPADAAESSLPADAPRGGDEEALERDRRGGGVRDPRDTV